MQTRIYKSGSIIYFLGDKADRIFLLKEGTLQSIFISTDTGKEERMVITTGNFFSVKSVMGMHTQEETIQCLSDVSVIIFTQQEFEDLVSKNTTVLLKILKIFAEQFREINRKLDTIFDPDRKDPKLAGENKKDGLNILGEYFYKNKRYKEAFHAFRKYLKIANPESTYYATAHQNMLECMKAISVSENELDGYEKKAEEERINKAKEFLEKEQSTAEGKFRKATCFAVLGEFNDSIAILRELIESGDETILDRATFNLGKYLFLNKEYDEAFNILLDFISKNQLSDYSKEVSLYLARIYAMNNNKDEAFKYYNKVINIPPIDRFTLEAKKEYDNLKAGK